MLRQVMDSFGIVEDYNLDIMKNRQTLTTITTSVLKKLEPILIKVKPDVVLVHGDTTTSCAEGDSPHNLLKIRLNWEKLEKPHSVAISVIFFGLLMSRY